MGYFRFNFALNRMHASAMNDTLGILFMLGGLIVMCGLSWHSLKLALVIVFFWIASPVSGHLISRLQVLLEEKPSEHYEDLTDAEYAEAFKKDEKPEETEDERH